MQGSAVSLSAVAMSLFLIDIQYLFSRAKNLIFSVYRHYNLLMD